MAASKIGPLRLMFCLAAALAGCETPTSYEAAAPGTAAPEPAQRPRFTPGDLFWFHAGGTEILVEEYRGMEDGFHVFDRALRNETLYYSPDMALVRVERAFGEDEIFLPDDGVLSFPLSVGKTWSRTYRVPSESRGLTGRRRRSCEVLDLGEVRPQAGTLLAYRIACTVSTLGQPNVARDEVFYAPAVGRIVLERSLGQGNVLSLIEYTRAE